MHIHEIYMNILTYSHINVYRTYTSTYTRIYSHMYVCIFIHMSSYIHMHRYAHMYVYTHMSVPACSHTHAHDTYVGRIHNRRFSLPP